MNARFSNHAFAIAALPLCLAGCGPIIEFTGHAPIESAKLDDNSYVALALSWDKLRSDTRVGQSPPFTILIGSDDGATKAYDLCWRPDEWKLDKGSGDSRVAQARPIEKKFDFERLEVRADSHRQRIWFVDSQSGLIFATLDRETGEADWLPAYRPVWAAPDSGVALPTAPFPRDPAFVSN